MTNKPLLEEEELARILAPKSAAKPVRKPDPAVGAPPLTDHPETEKIVEQTIPDPLQDIVTELGGDMACLATALKRLLEYSRVRVIGGWRKDRCTACDVPHLFWRPCECPHHNAVKLLKRFGVKVDA